MGILITPAELEPLLGRVRVLDVRWRLDAPDGLPAYRDGHIPTAAYVSLGDELARHGDAADGRHPLPDPAALQNAARTWGLRQGDTVVVYDDWSSMAAARAWWVLTDAGVADVRVLDGGLRAWREAGLPLEAGDATVVPGDVQLTGGHLPVLDIDEAAVLPATGVLIDVRAPERYRGDSEPIDPIGGHIPGAVNLPTAGNVDAEGRFLSPAALRERFDALGVDRGASLGVYCGSGVTASHAALALRLAGIDAALFPGSWSQWSNTPRRPVATGADA